MLPGSGSKPSVGKTAICSGLAGKKQVALVLVVMHDVTPLDAVQQYSSYTLIDIKQNKIVYAIPI